MSLLLRNACQETMDNAGLGNFHVRTNENNNTMTIVGECGQPFVSISGIKFARTAPSAAEIPLAVELLEVFLLKHKPDFDAYVRESAKYKKLAKVEPHTENFSIESNGYSDNAYWTCRIRSGCFKVKIREDGMIDKVYLNGSDSKFSMLELSKGPNIEHMLEGHQYLKNYLAYIVAGAQVNELKAKLSSCEI